MNISPDTYLWTGRTD